MFSCSLLYAIWPVMPVKRFVTFTLSYGPSGIKGEGEGQEIGGILNNQFRRKNVPRY